MNSDGTAKKLGDDAPPAPRGPTHTKLYSHSHQSPINTTWTPWSLVAGKNGASYFAAASGALKTTNTQTSFYLDDGGTGAGAGN